MFNSVGKRSWQTRVANARDIFPKPSTTHVSTIILLLMAMSAIGMTAVAQAGGHKLFGDLRVDESKAGEAVPLSYDVLLYSRSQNLLQRISIPNRGRYQFLGLADGYYDVVIEVENKEVARVRVSVFSPFKTDFRQDIELEWRTMAGETAKASAISAEDFYQRSQSNERVFRDAKRARIEKRYDQAIAKLRQLLERDSRDFQAWLELANIHYLQRKFNDGENEYLHAIDAHPGFFLALLNLGRLEIAQKKYDVAAEALTQALRSHPESPDANYFLGESYLQLRKGSIAIGYLNEALRLDPRGMAEVHLRLAMLYHGAGMKDKAAAEYEMFLKKKPDHPDRKMLEKYIAKNKKP